MLVTVNADKKNTKHILTLLEEMGYSLPCNCHGAHHCNGNPYSFDCSMIPKEPVTVTLPSSTQKIHGLSLENISPKKGPGDTLLIDLGTTTIALALIDRMSGELRQTSVFPNPGKRYGADIISRIRASMQGNKEIMQQELIHNLQTRIRLLCQRNQQDEGAITRCYLAGNTTMIHLLMGYDCTPLSSSPFRIAQQTPSAFFYKDCEIIIFPWITAFIGGDLTAGLYACDMNHSKKTSLLIDLGTNGEMILSHNSTLYAAATAAGPAFEGSSLSCGCPAIPGAVSRVVWKRNHPALTTIDNKIPVGLCGSGAISLTAELLRNEYLTSEGILSEKFPPAGILLGKRTDGTPLYFTADDLRNVQLSVAAIAAGMEAITRAAGISPMDLQQIYLGGGFGFFLNLSDCQTLHMFSSINPDVLQPMGNTCLKGMYLCATDDIRPQDIPSVKFVNLAESELFKERFISHMTYSDYDM